eukprot:scpid79301/ scgid10997/ 
MFGNSVQVSTFLSWNVGDSIGHDVERVGGKDMVTKVWCKLCAKHSDKIRSSSQLRGKALADMLKFVEGTNYVTKHAVTRHLSASKVSVYFPVARNHRTSLVVNASIVIVCPQAHAAAIAHEAIVSSTMLPAPQHLCRRRRQPLIDSALQKQAQEATRELLNMAYIVPVGEQPFSTFTTMVKVQKANGVQLLKGCESSDRAREFVKYLAVSILKTIVAQVSQATAFSVLSDGSQARKTGSEKELVLVHLVKQGLPTFFTLGLMNVDDYGDATSANLNPDCIVLALDR